MDWRQRGGGRRERERGREKRKQHLEPASLFEIVALEDGKWAKRW